MDWMTGTMVFFALGFTILELTHGCKYTLAQRRLHDWDSEPIEPKYFDNTCGCRTGQCCMRAKDRHRDVLYTGMVFWASNGSRNTINSQTEAAPDLMNSDLQAAKALSDAARLTNAASSEQVPTWNGEDSLQVDYVRGTCALMAMST
jgi:hypothetical protein